MIIAIIIDDQECFANCLPVNTILNSKHGHRSIDLDWLVLAVNGVRTASHAFQICILNCPNLRIRTQDTNGRPVQRGILPIKWNRYSMLFEWPTPQSIYKSLACEPGQHPCVLANSTSNQQSSSTCPGII